MACGDGDQPRRGQYGGRDALRRARRHSDSVVDARLRRRRDRDDDERDGEDARYRGAPAYPFQPPVIVVAGGQPQQLPADPNLVTPAPIYPAANAQAWSGGQGGNRVYRLVGEQEEWLER
ncbi:MAG: hypothetical protein IPK16_21140 [Anaerolineales bacterium]|nr:hypothetical protein [Anaerolineales bacterium]